MKAIGNNIFNDPEKTLDALRQTVGGLQEYVTLLDTKGIIRFVTRADFGLKEDHLIGRHITKMLAPEQAEQINKNFEKALRGQEESFESSASFADGSSQYFQNIIKPLYEDDKIVGVAFITKNITKEKELEEAMKESEERFRKLVESALDIIYSCDYKGYFTYFNPVAERITGLTNNDLHGLHFTDLVRDDYKERMVEYYQKQFETKTLNTYYEFPIIAKSGKQIWLGQNVQMKLEGEYVIGFQAVARDITEKKEFEKMLMAARIKAEESSKAKEQYLSVMSHEIRTPLNAVIGLTNLLIEEKPTNKQSEHLKAIKFSADSLLNIINDILDFSKIESGKVSFEKEDFRIDYTLEGVKSAMQMEANAKGITLNTSISNRVPNVINGDNLRLNQILFNLISNSIKFTEKGQVDINIDLIKEYEKKYLIQFVVKDTGIGIAKDKQKDIFESFTQASKETTRKYGGTGLGLTITKQIIKLMGGEISLKSELGKGTEFSFSLVFGKGKSSSSAFNTDSKVKSFKKFIDLNCLLVEDNKMNQLVAGKYLKKWGIELDIAENGIEALKKINQADYDFILMDLQMPNMNGYDTTKYIRQKLASPKNEIPIIAITASTFSNVRNKLLESGMNDYISKPFEPSNLYSIIAKITNQNFNEVPKISTSNTEMSTQLINLSYLKDASGGDNQFILKMIETFIKHYPDYIEQFQKTYEKDDLPELKRMVHKYKATVSIVGIKKIEDLIEEVESNISNDENIDDIPDLLAQITSYTLQATEELKQEMDKL